jgi:hypothetical protein
MGTMSAGISLIDSKSIHMNIMEDGKRIAFIVMSATDIDELTRALSKLRANLTPEVSRTLPVGTTVDGEMDPLFAVPTDPKAPDKLLVIRHFGLGWLSFFLPAESALKLGNLLLSGQTQTDGQPISTARH